MYTLSILLSLTDLESYEQTGKHTYLPMSITMVTVLVTLVALVVLYKVLAPRYYTDTRKATNLMATLASPTKPECRFVWLLSARL